METGSSRRANAAPRGTGLTHLWPALLVCALVLGLGYAGYERQRRAEAAALQAQQMPEILPWIDPGAARVLAAPAWIDPRWLERVSNLLAELEPCETGTVETGTVETGTVETGTAETVTVPWLEPLRDALAGLSFVERVARCELTSERGLALDLVLRRPVACIPVGGEFALVDEDGVVLEGRWPVPPRLGRAHLPVLGPLDDALFARARAGDWLVEPEHTDALDVALSMAENLHEDERAGLGRIVIDARSARRASVAEPGVRLELEGERLALFGRAPSHDAPGELAAASKWSALTRARELFARDPMASDWELVDLRWDRPDLALRNAPELAAATEAGTTRARHDAPNPRGTRTSPARSRAAAAQTTELDPSRPRVR